MDLEVAMRNLSLEYDCVVTIGYDKQQWSGCMTTAHGPRTKVVYGQHWTIVINKLRKEAESKQ